MAKKFKVNRKAARRFANRHRKVRSVNYGAGRGGLEL